MTDQSGRWTLNSFSHLEFILLATRDTIKMTQLMARAGADAVLVVTPCFYKNRMTNSALHDHFLKVSLTSVTPSTNHLSKPTI